jgi:hypothetical protein
MRRTEPGGIKVNRTGTATYILLEKKLLNNYKVRCTIIIKQEFKV